MDLLLRQCCPHGTRTPGWNDDDVRTSRVEVVGTSGTTGALANGLRRLVMRRTVAWTGVEPGPDDNRPAQDHIIRQVRSQIGADEDS